ncbi:MAG: hypothetical protein DMF76_09925 [Acidobacteria bacterium]|nr:MAG: hypothetical protein DMF76_09925 [Acidobacteriota bacterium]
MFQYPELNFTNRDSAEFPETLSFGMDLIDFTAIAHPSLAGDRHPQLLRQQRTALHFEQLHKLIIAGFIRGIMQQSIFFCLSPQFTCR